MARGRLLPKEICRDIQVAQLSVHSQLLFTWAWAHLDVEGRMDGLPLTVRGSVVPANALARPDEWTDARIDRYMREWMQTEPYPLVLIYHPDGGHLVVCFFPRFLETQRLRRDREKPSELPAPPAALLARYAELRDAVPGQARDAVPDRTADADSATQHAMPIATDRADADSAQARDADPDRSLEGADADSALTRDRTSRPDRPTVHAETPQIPQLRSFSGPEAEAEVQVLPPEQRVLQDPARAIDAALADTDSDFSEQELPAFPLQALLFTGDLWKEARAFFEAEVAPVLGDSRAPNTRTIHERLFAQLGPNRSREVLDELIAATAKTAVRNRARYLTRIGQRILQEQHA